MTHQLSPMWRALVGAMVRIQARGLPEKKTVSTRSLAETARESKEVGGGTRTTTSA